METLLAYAERRAGWGLALLGAGCSLWACAVLAAPAPLPSALPAVALLLVGLGLLARGAGQITPEEAPLGRCFHQMARHLFVCGAVLGGLGLTLLT